MSVTMTTTMTYGGDIRCEIDGEIVGWVQRTPAGRWVARVDGDNYGGTRVIGRHTTRERAIARIAEFDAAHMAEDG